MTTKEEQQIKAELDGGLSVMDICRSGRYDIQPAQLYAKRRKWEKGKYQAGSGKYAKYKDPKYIAWRLKVLKIDGNKCRICGRKKGQVKALQVDHIKSWALHPHLRFDPNNGRVLCSYHHRRTLNYGRKALKCDDSKNGRIWEIKEQMLWKKKQQQKLLRLLKK